MVEQYKKILAKRTDIQDHLGVIRGLAMQCPRVVEFGLRTGVTTTAMLDGTKTKVWSYDINKCTDAVSAMSRLGKGRFTFIQGNSMDVEIPECDMLLIDSKHDYAVLIRELNLHEDKVEHWIVMHDTHTFAKKGETLGDPGLQKAIDEFLGKKRDWKLLLHLPNQNGLTILERVDA